jgi:hypothetical protein
VLPPPAAAPPAPESKAEERKAGKDRSKGRRN